MAGIANEIGHHQNDLGVAGYNLSHAALGCAVAVAQKGDCSSGALGAVAAENIAHLLGKSPADYTQKDILLVSQLAAIGSAALANKTMEDAFAAGSNAVVNNYLKHTEQREMIKKLQACQDTACKVAVFNAYEQLSDENFQKELAACTGSGQGSAECQALVREHEQAIQSAQEGWNDDLLYQVDDRYAALVVDRFKQLAIEEKWQLADTIIAEDAQAVLEASGMETDHAAAIASAAGMFGIFGKGNKGAKEAEPDLYRGDGRSSEQVFKEGLQPWDRDGTLDLPTHVNTDPSPRTNNPWLSTSKSRAVADDFAIENGSSVYVIDGKVPNQVDVNKTLGIDNVRFPREQEISIKGGVDPCYIKGCYNVNTGEFTSNPNYTVGD